MIRVLMAVLAVLASVATASAQSYGPPTYSVGDTWKRSHGADPTVVKADDNEVVMKGAQLTCATCLYQMDRNLTILNVTQADGKAVDVTQLYGVPLSPDWRLLDFPLEVKKTWRIQPQGWYRGSPTQYTAECTVLAYEDVKTKAGTFKAYKINYAWTVHTRRGDFRWTNVAWFAPEARSTVKFETGSPNRESPDAQDWELVSYSLK